jgi:hypothetical protein
MFRRAVDRGQLPAGTLPEEVVRHVGAPLYYRLAEPLTPEAADLAAAVNRGSRPCGRLRPTRSRPVNPVVAASADESAGREGL